MGKGTVTMQIVRIYYDERRAMWKIEIAFDGRVYVIPLSVAVEFASKLLRLVTMQLIEDSLP